MSLFKSKNEGSRKAVDIEIDLKSKDETINSLKESLKTNSILTTDLKDKVKAMRKMLTDKDMLIVKKDVEINELKEELKKYKG